MNKLAVMVSVFVLVVLVFMVTMHVKNDVQAMRAKRDKLVEEQITLQETMRVLEAEYTYLTRPERLESFANAMRLKRFSAGQIVGVKSASYRSSGGGL